MQQKQQNGEQKKPQTWLIIDCQNDFITGSLACVHAEEAVRWIVQQLQAHPEYAVRYSSDWHQETNQSFAKWGGTWPVHCVQNTKGAALHPSFYTLTELSQRPDPQNLYLKGRADSPEEYSAECASNAEGQTFFADLPSEVWVCGIASEYCVRETVLALLRTGRTVHLLIQGLGYVQEEDHRNNINDLETRGVHAVR